MKNKNSNKSQETKLENKELSNENDSLNFDKQNFSEEKTVTLKNKKSSNAKTNESLLKHKKDDTLSTKLKSLKNRSKTSETEVKNEMITNIIEKELSSEDDVENLDLLEEDLINLEDLEEDIKDEEVLKTFDDYYNKVLSLVDDDIKQRIIHLHPVTIFEFKSIHGIDDEKFSELEQYINEIDKIHKENAVVPITPIVKERLENLRNRLINISQGNNIIWNSKEQTGKLLDMSIIDKKNIDEIYSSIFNRSNTKKKISLSIKNEVIEEKYFKTNVRKNWDIDKKTTFINDKQVSWLQQIYRENDKQKLEKGKNILYISPVTIEGNFELDEEKRIKVRAPLFLFPVSLALSDVKKRWEILIDISRDVLTNQFVENYVLEGSEYEYSYEISLEENVKEFIKKNKKIENNFTLDVNTFEEIPGDAKSPFKIGEFAVCNNLLLGLFSDFGDDIQSEISSLLLEGKSTPMLNAFLSNEDLHSRDEVEEVISEVGKDMNDDTDLVYTNNLNEQQLRALKMINTNGVRGMTIWGPPGTGKSETIISIIENAVSKGKRVAVVSEKQIALEVIKKRLKIIQNNSIMVSDSKDKLAFYEQLSLLLKRRYYNSSSHSNELKLKLKEKFDDLDTIYKKFGYNNKNILDHLTSIFMNPVQDTTDSKRIAFEDAFLPFENIELERFTEVLRFIDSFDSKEQLENVLQINSNYYGKYKNFNELEGAFEKKIRNQSKKIAESDKILKFKEELIGKKKKNLKKIVEENNLNIKLTKDILKEIKKGTFFTRIEFKNKKNESWKQELIYEIEWIRQRREVIDSCLKQNKEMVKVIELFEKGNLQGSVQAVRVNLIKRLLNSRLFKTKIDLLVDYDKHIKEIKEITEKLKNSFEDSIKEALDNNLRKINYNRRENNMKKLAEKKRPLAIWKFMKLYSLEMKNLVQVWLMQPEVVPTMFDIYEKFDYVIFDEASQVYLERTIPAIARAKQVIVLGDEKQLGPSSFFAGRLSQDGGEDNIFEDDESLLTYSKTKLPEVMLKNHYRSQDLDLIKFSNGKYYDGNLSFIDSISSEEKLPVEYVFVKDSNYSDGKNEKEGKKVIDILKTLRRTRPKDTVGIITSNSKQETFIYNTLMGENYKLFQWAKENDVFVKSIESVQGDERDVIIFSTTYGPDPDGNQRVNFGPINQALGSNRINVAVTRAKKKMFVVSSIDINQAKQKVANSLHQGPRDFIDYIDFSKNILAIKKAEEESKKSRNKKVKFSNSDGDTLKSSVHEELPKIASKSGIEIIEGYEALGYNIDYVLIDKKTKQKLLAILYGDSRNTEPARLKDFLTQEFLESRGWKIHKLWASNWWMDRENEKEKIVKKALSNKK